MKKIVCLVVGIVLMIVGCSQPTDVTFVELKGNVTGTTHGHFSSDGKKIIIGNLDGTARIWDTESGEKLRV